MIPNDSTSPAAVFPADPSAPALRVGVLTDIHVTPPETGDEWFVKALRRFDAERVDAVLVAGDLTTWSRRFEFEAAAAAWHKVFPEDRRSDGAKVERVFIAGNHDVDGFFYPDGKFASKEEALRESIKVYLHSEEARQLLYGPVSDWMGRVSEDLEAYTSPICRRWHVPDHSLKISSQLSASDLHILEKVDARSVFAGDTLAGAAFFVESVISVIVGLLCGGSGMALIAEAAWRRGFTKENLTPMICEAAKAYGLPTQTDYPAEEIARIALVDKKRRGGEITLVVPREIGRYDLVKVPVGELIDWASR